MTAVGPTAGVNRVSLIPANGVFARGLAQAVPRAFSSVNTSVFALAATAAAPKPPPTAAPQPGQRASMGVRTQSALRCFHQVAPETITVSGLALLMGVSTKTSENVMRKLRNASLVGLQSTTKAGVNVRGNAGPTAPQN